jgi:hypothetical protein
MRALRLEPKASAPNVIGGYASNVVRGGAQGATIGGGGKSDGSNAVAGAWGTVSGGWGNVIGTGAQHATISGGAQNEIGLVTEAATIAGGYQNSNQRDARFAAIGGGRQNIIQTNAQFATIAGGKENSVGIGAESAVIAGGEGNTVQAAARYASVGGGAYNMIGPNAQYAVIGGGNDNDATNQYATVPGGMLNIAGGLFSFAAGQRARSVHDGAFVWADSVGVPFDSQARNEFAVRAGGGVRIEAPSLRLEGGRFIGDGSGLTNLSAIGPTGEVNADRITSGTLADARLSANVARLNSNQTFTADQRFTGRTILSPPPPYPPFQTWSRYLVTNLNADLLDGYSREHFLAEIAGRVSREGDSMNGRLWVQGLSATGNNATGGVDKAVGAFISQGVSGSAAPALRVETQGGASADGALSVMMNGEGYVTRLGAQGRYHVSLDRNGTLGLEAGEDQTALAIEGHGGTVVDITTTNIEGTLRAQPALRLKNQGYASPSVLQVINNGQGGLASFDTAAGPAFSVANEGDVFVARNLTVGGNVWVRNMPFVKYVQSRYSGRNVPPSPWCDPFTICDLTVDVPGAGVLFIHGHAALAGVCRQGGAVDCGPDPDEPVWEVLETVMSLLPVPRSRAEAKAGRFAVGLYQVADPDQERVLSMSGRELDPDIFGDWRSVRQEVSWVLAVQSGPVKLRLKAKNTTDGGIQEYNLTAMYFPLPVQ